MFQLQNFGVVGVFNLLLSPPVYEPADDYNKSLNTTRDGVVRYVTPPLLVHGY